jgi:hypothetical protein
VRTQKYLNGAKNRTDDQRRSEFRGTLHERRNAINAQREAQGTQAPEVIRKMRETEGLDKAAAGANDDVAGAAGMVRELPGWRLPRAT